MSQFFYHRSPLKTLLAVISFVLGFMVTAQAQNYFILSSQSDADSSEFFYQEGATLYMKVYSQTVDFNNMERMKWELEKEMEGEHHMMGDMGYHFEGFFQNNMDGSFSAEFDLNQLMTGGEWKWKAQLRDQNGNRTEFEAKITYMHQGNDSIHQYIELKDEISAINGDTLFIGQYAFVVDTNTIIMGPHEGMLTLSDLKPGDFVEVEGQGLYDNVYWAQKIKLEDKNENEDHHEMEIKGRISAIYDSSIVVNDMTFRITSQTMILDHNKMSLSFTDLKIGMFVEIEAQMRNGNKVALKIKLEEQNEDAYIVEFKGMIDSLTSEYLVLGSQRVYYDSTTVVKFETGMGSIGDLQVGQFVEIKAKITPDGRLWAHKIEVEDFNGMSNKVVVKGAVDSVGIDFIIVYDQIIYVNDSTEIYGANHVRMNFSDLHKGHVVKVKGMLQNDGSILALTIKVKELWSKFVEVEGTIESINTNGFTVQGVYFAVDSTTRFYGHNHQPLSFSDLQTGDLVEVKARRLADGSLLAVKVKLENKSELHVRVTGEIQSLTSDSVRVNQMNFAIDSLTMVYDLQDSLVTLAALEVGQIVDIKAVIQTDGTYRAVKIEIEYDPSLVSINSTLGGKTESSVIVLGTEYVVTPNTVILDSSFNPIDYASLTPGSDVTVWAVSTNNGYDALQIQTGTTSGVTAIESQTGIIKSFALKQNYPNPFNPTTTIEFSLNQNGFEKVSLVVYNILGKKVKTLYSGVLNQGTYRFEWNGTNEANQPVATGLYFYRLQVKNQASVKQMILIK